LNDPLCRDSDINILRELYIELDKAVLACYQWSEIDLKHGFYQNERGQTRFTIESAANKIILRRLIELNLHIWKAE